MDLLKISSQDVKVVLVLRLLGCEAVKWCELILASVVPLAGCEEVKWCELILASEVPLAGCEEMK